MLKTTFFVLISNNEIVEKKFEQTLNYRIEEDNQVEEKLQGPHFEKKLAFSLQEKERNVLMIDKHNVLD